MTSASHRTGAARSTRLVALALVATLALPTLALTAGCGNKDNGSGQVATQPVPPPAPAAKPGLTTKQKVVLLAGAALLFYLYKRYQTQDAAAAQNGGAGAHPQLYREDKGPNKGAIYYRKNDAAHTVVWLSAPAGGVQVPADQVQRYLPNYGADPNAYQGQVNTNPQPIGGAVQPADQYAGAASQ